MHEELSTVTVNDNGIDLSKLSDTKNKSVKILKSLGNKFNAINSTLSDLAQLEADCDTELTDIRKEIAELTVELKKRQKELKQTLKIIAQKRLIMLGERSVYLKEINELGGKVKQLDIKKLIAQ